MTLNESLIASSPDGVSIHEGLPGGWLAIVAKHPRKVPLVDYLKHPPEVLMSYALAVADRWAFVD